MSEKKGHPGSPSVAKRSIGSRFKHVIVFGLFICSWLFVSVFHFPVSPNGGKLYPLPANADELCPLRPIIKPSYSISDNGSTIHKILYNEYFKNESIQKLSGAVQVHTESYDSMPPPGVDPRWDIFKDFHIYLEKTFPTIYDKLKVETVNTYGLLFTWQGSDESLKPILLTAHQDTVPVDKNVYGQWKYPPFDGYYDGEFLWGRGSADCKNLLIGILEAVETLLEDDFNPKRTVLLSFGFDEESTGQYGAKYLGQFLLERYGPNSIFALIDEGVGIIESSGLVVASPATAEKGFVNYQITLDIAGGHSSFPPDHTAIGIVSQLVSLIESTPFKPQLTPVNPFLDYLQCLAVHSPVLPPDFKSNILKAHLDKDANEKLVKYLDSVTLQKYFIKTSQAADIFNSGVKSNALPESATLLMNSRVSVESSIKETGEKYLNNVIEIAKKYDIGVEYLGETIIQQDNVANGIFNITLEGALEPSPVSPSSGKSWDLLAGTVRHLYENVAPHIFPDGKDEDGKVKSKEIIVAPILLPANTDTKCYWDLTENIYRFTPISAPPDFNNVHKVDEYTSVESHLLIVGFIHEYILNADALEGN